MAPAEAPRFRMYLEHVEGRSVLTMSRPEWDSLSGGLGNPVLIDVQRTPMGAVASDASVVAAVAQRYSEATAEVVIYRYDQRDQPTPYNLDKYTVWVDLPSHSSFSQMIAGASTKDDANFRQFLSENVFFVGQGHGPDHWLPELPASVRSIIDST